MKQMNNITDRIDALDWPEITAQLHQKGFAVIRDLLPADQCNDLITSYGSTPLYRKTIVMERYRFGLGEYKYFNYPLPEPIQTIREKVYPKLVPIANTWMEALHLPNRFPVTLKAMQQLCRANNQTKPTALILKYGKGGHNTLHQDVYGNIFFPIQLVMFLNEPGKDYTGGEFVLTQQTPRAQSRAIVITPGKGDLLLFTTSFRPVKGSKGFYRANMKHGVSELHRGERHTVGIIFHDAEN